MFGKWAIDRTLLEDLDESSPRLDYPWEAT